MRVLIFSDLHLGVETYSRTDEETGWGTRFLDFLSAFDETVDFAIKEKVDLVLFCGDAYKSKRPTPTQEREFARRIKRLSDAGINSVLLAGNHDLPSVIRSRASTLDIYETLDISLITVANRPGIKRLRIKDRDVQIITMPWVQSIPSEERSISEARENVEEYITYKLLELSREISKDMPSILCAHLTVSSASLGSERGMLIGSDPVILESTLTSLPVSLIALGHVHKKQILSEKPLILYPGSLQPIDFGDEGLDKGFFIVEMDRDIRSYEFIKVKTRPFITINLDLVKNPVEREINRLKEINVKDAIVRVRIRATPEKRGLLKDEEITGILYNAGAHYVKTETHIEERKFYSPRSEVLSDEELLREYFRGDLMAEELIRRGMELLGGEV